MINPDTCLGVIESAGHEVARIVVAPDGEEVYFLHSFPGVTIPGLFRRVPVGSCSKEVLP